MNIGIIGSGEMGSCLASKFIQLGHDVSIANSRGPASLKQFAEDTGVKATTVEEVVKDRDLIVVAIPQKNIPGLTNLFRQIAKDTIVIDLGNYYPFLRDGNIPSLDQTGIDSLWVQEQLGIPVIKVFNSILGTSLKALSKPKGEKKRIALAVSGDDKKAKEIVFNLVDDLGFDPYDIGTLDQSWKQQPGSPIYCRDINLEKLKKRINEIGTERSDMLAVIAKRKVDEVLMKSDYPKYLQGLKD